MTHSLGDLSSPTRDWIQATVVKAPNLNTTRHQHGGLPWWLSGKESTCNAGDMGSIPGLGRSPGEGNGSLLQHSCLGNLMDGEPGGLQSTQSQRVGHNLATKQQDHQETLYFCFLPCLSSVWIAVTMNRSSINFLFLALIFLSESLFQKKTQNYNLINKDMGLPILFCQGKYIFSKHVMIRNSIRQLLNRLITQWHECISVILSKIGPEDQSWQLVLDSGLWEPGKLWAIMSLLIKTRSQTRPVSRE